MSFRFRTSVKLAPGIRLNFSRSGVSTTFGGRGLSMNVGRRGTRVTAGIPGTGLSFHSRAGGATGGANGGGRRGAHGTAGEAEGCMGCGAAGFLLLLLMGLCASPDTPRGSSYTPQMSAASAATQYTPPEPRETFYLHASMNVRTGPGKDFDRVRTLQRGDRVTLGAKDARGWAPLFSGYGQREGYVYRASDNVRSYAPSAARARPQRTRHPSGASALCRDGTYSYSGSRRGTCSWHGGVAQWL